MKSSFALNERGLAIVQSMLARANELRIEHEYVAQARVVDCGARALGGIQAGLELARVCLAGLAEVAVVPGSLGSRSWPHLQVCTDHPVAACLASQYAGWKLSEGKFFAMGSGPMRAAAGSEAIFEKIENRESTDSVVGVLECRKPPTPEIIAIIAEACRISEADVTLLFAPTASLAGTMQIVARSVETALHKLAELGFDLARLVSAIGWAPIPAIAKDDLAAIGRTNDAILYGGRVILCATGDDDSIRDIGSKLPSVASRDHGAPFAEIFARYNHDFYAVDPLLFSPAQVVLQNLSTGRVHEFGHIEPAVLERSFGLAGS